jgi:hypothetical protein
MIRFPLVVSAFCFVAIICSSAAGKGYLWVLTRTLSEFKESPMTGLSRWRLNNRHSNFSSAAWGKGSGYRSVVTDKFDH